jgi:hypothetical protein
VILVTTFWLQLEFDGDEQGGCAMSNPNIIGNIIVYVACIVLSGGVIWLIATGQEDTAWHWFRSLPIVVQILLAILTLPWLLAVWVWQTSWGLPVRIMLAGALVLFPLFAFFPRPAGA